MNASVPVAVLMAMDWSGMAVIVGGTLAMTSTARFAVDEFPASSVTVNVTCYTPTVAVGAAEISAVTVPAVFVMFVTVNPVGTPVAVTTRLPAAVSVSDTVPTLAAVAVAPWTTLTVPPGVRTGSVLSTSTLELGPAPMSLPAVLLADLTPSFGPP